MNKRLLMLLMAVMPMMGAMAQEEIEVTTQQAGSMYKATTKKYVSVHDPSVVWEPTSKRYYIFGSHRGAGYTQNMQTWSSVSVPWKAGTNNNAGNDKAFVSPKVTKVKKGGVEVDLPAFNAMDWAARTDDQYDITGNMWAPDVIWNEAMQKWCMYLSINGDGWHSSIILLTADHIAGPYEYQAPIVISGFDNSAHSYKDTDLEVVLGTLSSLPGRYNVGSGWGRRWPNNIDPAVFYDEEGSLRMIYGSWSGGIWMLDLDEQTGLRDYDVQYTLTGSGDGITVDPYFGKKIAGGYYVSGEGAYIEHIGNYYYLFVSYGFFSPNGGYEMRVFRSDRPDGPYKDASGRPAIFSSYVMNYGTGSSDMRGEKIMGAYGNWGFMTTGECAQGHNSIIAAPDGKTYLVYHTKFNDGNPDAGFHSVRVHQVFLNKQGWLVASPFEYNGDDIADADIASRQVVLNEDVPGIYHLLVHKYRMNYENMEEVQPVEIELTADGNVTGKYTGTWSIEPNTGYLTIKLGTVTYNGVIFEQTMDGMNIKTVSFSAMSTGGVNVWGYKYRDDYSIAWHVKNQKLPVSSNMQVNKNIDLYSMAVDVDNVALCWASSEPGVISDYGKYYPLGLEEDLPVTLTARLQSGRYFWQQAYQVTARSEANSMPASDTWANDMMAHYKFDDAELQNSLNTTEKAQLLRNSATALPSLEQADSLRNGKVVHLAFGRNGEESYVSMPNPLKGLELADGATVSFFVNRTDDNLWDALFGLVDGNARLYMTGNLYLGYNNGKVADATNGVYNNWVDINHPEKVQPGRLTTGRWHQVTITFDRKVTTTTGGIIIYVDGLSTRSSDRYNGLQDGRTISARQNFKYDQVVDHLAACAELWLGNGSFWGSADARFDDVIVYSRALTSSEVSGLYQMTNRSDVAGKVTGIEDLRYAVPDADAVYDLSGRRVSAVSRGIYIKNGKKYVVK